MSSVVFVTGNAEKAARFSQHMGMSIEHKSVELDEIQTLSVEHLVEHKARQAYEQIGKPVLVEDVTFTFEALGAMPGPFIKFFVDADNGVENMCRMLDGFDNRRAKGCCTFGYFDGDEIKIFSGAVQGAVAENPRGCGGYGFDKIFEIDGFGGRTAAELTDAEYDVYYTTIKPFADVRRFLESLR